MADCADSCSCYKQLLNTSGAYCSIDYLDGKTMALVISSVRVTGSLSGTRVASLEIQQRGTNQGLPGLDSVGQRATGAEPWRQAQLPEHPEAEKQHIYRL